MIQLQQDFERTTTNVPNLFIDEYMTEANGEFVKVYLYLLRCISGRTSECSVCSIADHCGHTENDVLRALRYWERVGLVKLTCDADGQISGIRLCELRRSDSSHTDGLTSVSGANAATAANATASVNAAASTKAGTSDGSLSGEAADDTSAFSNPKSADSFTHPDSPAGFSGTDSASAYSGSDSASAYSGSDSAIDFSIPNSEAAAQGNPLPVMTGNHNITAFRVKPVSSPKEYTPDEVNEFRRDPNVCELFYVIETYLKHPLSSNDTNTILYWYDALHFATDLICYLVEYCISKGHSNLRYMDKVAMGWKDAGVATVEQAKEHAAAHSKAYYAVMKAFGITGRSLTEEETSSVTRWTKEYGFDLPIVLEACRRTMSAIHQPSFEYTEAILKDWQKNNVHTTQDIQSLDKDHTRAKKHSMPLKENARRNNKFNNFNQRDYNYEQLEQYLLNSTVQ